MSARKEVQQLIKKARLQGWVIVLTNGGHYKWTNPGGEFFFSPSSPSDPRSINNMESDLKARGFIEITKKGKPNVRRK
jgi:hypothetical protein